MWCATKAMSNVSTSGLRRALWWMGEFSAGIPARRYDEMRFLSTSPSPGQYGMGMPLLTTPGSPQQAYTTQMPYSAGSPGRVHGPVGMTGRTMAVRISIAHVFQLFLTFVMFLSTFWKNLGSGRNRSVADVAKSKRDLPFADIPKFLTCSLIVCTFSCCFLSVLAYLSPYIERAIRIPAKNPNIEEHRPTTLDAQIFETWKKPRKTCPRKRICLELLASANLLDTNRDNQEHHLYMYIWFLSLFSDVSLHMSLLVKIQLKPWKRTTVGLAIGNHPKKPV